MFNLHSAEARPTDNGFILGLQPERARGRCPPAAGRPNLSAGWWRPRQLRPVSTWVALVLVPSLCLAPLLTTAADAPAPPPRATSDEAARQREAVRQKVAELDAQKGSKQPVPASVGGSDKALDSATVAREVGGLQPGASLAVSPMPRAAATGNPGTNVVSAVSGHNLGELDDKQKLGVGDRVTFRVVEDQEEPRALTVTDAGELNVPELGLVTAAGKTCKQLALEIKPKLEATTYYHATVIIGIDLLNKTMSGRRVYVAGEVPRPGPQEVPAGEAWTVTRAIMRAGGFTQYADKKSVRLVRAGTKDQSGKSFTLNVVEVWEKGRTELDLPVEPEDVIYVPTRAVNF